jgi:hypothetical protein
MDSKIIWYTTRCTSASSAAAELVKGRNAFLIIPDKYIILPKIRTVQANPLCYLKLRSILSYIFAVNSTLTKFALPKALYYCCLSYVKIASALPIVIEEVNAPFIKCRIGSDENGSYV